VSTFSDYLRLVVTLTAVVDPFLAVPFFLTFTATRGEDERRRLARIVALTVFIVLAVAVFIGEALLELIGASLSAFRVGGGLVLLLMALAMLNAQAGGVRQSRAEAQELEQGELQGVVPLAMPLLAGPGSIATCIVLMARARGGPWWHALPVLGAIGLTCAAAYLLLASAPRTEKVLGPSGLAILERAAGLLLVAIAVQFMLDGLSEALPAFAGLGR